jgi:hypothetical protein
MVFYTVALKEDSQLKATAVLILHQRHFHLTVAGALRPSRWPGEQ